MISCGPHLDVVEDGAKLIGICNRVAVGARPLAAGVRPSDEAWDRGP